MYCVRIVSRTPVQQQPANCQKTHTAVWLQDIMVEAAGVYDVQKHFKSKLYQRNVNQKVNQLQMTMSVLPEGIKGCL